MADTAAEMIADDLEQIASEQQLRDFAREDYGDLSQHRTLVMRRLGADYDAEAWEAAMDILKDRYGAADEVTQGGR